MVKVMASMVLDRLPKHSGHPLQDFHLHLVLHKLGRELQNDLQTPVLLLGIVKTVRGMCMDGGGMVDMIVMR